MKHLFLTLVLINILTFRLFAQNCSVKQETADLGIGYACDDLSGFVGIDDFHIPAGENWYVDRVKLYIISAGDPITYPPTFLCDFGPFVNGYWSPYAGGEAYSQTYNSVTPLYSGDYGTTYEFDMNFVYPVLLTGGVSGTDVFMSTWILSDDPVSDYYWDMDTNSVNNDGLNGRISSDYTNWIPVNADFSFEVFYKKNSYDPQIACDQFTWINGTTYTQSQYAYHLLPGAAANGCDSVITLQLNLSNSVTHTDTVEACSEYTWINGVTYTESTNTPQFTFPGGAANGCDSTVTLELDIDVSAHITHNQNNNTLIASGGALYQWMDCTTNTTIMGATMSIFTPTQNGTYAAIITNNGICFDTTDCVQISGVGIDSPEQHFFSIFPNPTNESFTIHFTGGETGVLTLFDQNGTLVFSTNADHNHKIAIDKLSSGVYTAEFKIGNSISRQRLVKL